MYKYGDEEMTSKDALLILEHRISPSDFACDIQVALKEAKKALSFRCVKKAKKHNYNKLKDGELYFDRICPSCKEKYIYVRDKWIKYCPYCGQNLEL